MRANNQMLGPHGKISLVPRQRQDGCRRILFEALERHVSLSKLQRKMDAPTPLQHGFDLWPEIPTLSHIQSNSNRFYLWWQTGSRTRSSLEVTMDSTIHRCRFAAPSSFQSLKSTLTLTLAGRTDQRHRSCAQCCSPVHVRYSPQPSAIEAGPVESALITTPQPSQKQADLVFDSLPPPCSLYTVALAAHCLMLLFWGRIMGECIVLWGKGGGCPQRYLLPRDRDEVWDLLPGS